MLIKSQNYKILIPTKTPFKNIKLNQWYTKYIYTAKQLHLLTQTETYNIDKEITREEIIENLYKALKQKQTKTINSSKKNTYYKVVKVIDGDTIKVKINNKIETIRILGLNTPETVDPRKPVQCFGIEASNKAKELLTNKEIQLIKDPTQNNRGKYNRLIRYVILKDGTNYSKLMIENGYGHEYTYNTPYKLQQEFKQAEKKARTEKKGLWANNACTNTKPISTTTLSQQTRPTTPPNCQTNTYNCKDFKTQKEAQQVYLQCLKETSKDIHILDKDKDGIACESLP